MKLFWISLAVLIYVYIGYPFLMIVISNLFKKEFRAGTERPSVSLLISAHDEEEIIEKKLKNTTELDYPNIQVILLDDGSKDRTVEIASKFNVEIVRTDHVGKNTAINRAWEKVKGDIVVFSDANSMYSKDAIRKLVRWFSDPRVGCVCGELRYVDVNTGVARGESLYWKYEQMLKKAQGAVGELLVGNGAMIAIRKELFERLHLKVANDFELPQIIAHKGYKVLYEPEAAATERAEAKSADQFRRKVRIVSRGIEGTWHLIGLMRPLRFLSFLSHKLLRWFAWAFLGLLLYSSWAVSKELFYLQLVFYALAAIGGVLRLRTKLFSVPWYFVMVNTAALLGLLSFIFRTQKGKWEVRR